MDARQIAGLLIDAGALTFNVREPYTYASGIKSPVYMDCRLLISDVGKRGIIVDEMVKVVKRMECDLIAATASAGIPWGSWLADRLRLPLVYVRKNIKDHGKGKKVEGVLEKGQRAIVVEDLVSTGGSSISTIESLRREGALVGYCVSIFTYGMAEARDGFANSGVELYSLSNFHAAVEEALKRGSLTREESLEAKEWSKDPMRWRA